MHKDFSSLYFALLECLVIFCNIVHKFTSTVPSTAHKPIFCNSSWPKKFIHPYNFT